MSLSVTKRPAKKRRMLLKDRLPDELHQNARGQHRKIRGEALDPREVPEELPRELRLRGAVHPPPKLKGSIGEGPNHSNFSDRSSVRILGIQRKPRKAPSRTKPLQRSSIRPKIQEGAARMERIFQNSGIFA